EPSLEPVGECQRYPGAGRWAFVRRIGRVARRCGPARGTPWVEAVEPPIGGEHDILQDVIEIAILHPQPAQRLAQEGQTGRVDNVEGGPRWGAYRGVEEIAHN